MTTRYICSFDSCGYSYANKAGLKQHCLKKHQHHNTSLQAPIVKKIAVSTEPEENELQKQVATLQEKIRHLESKIQLFESELFAHVTDLREQMSLVVKQTTKWCVVCFSKEIQYAFSPCNHRCACETCARKVFAKFQCCPICRNASSSVIPIYEMHATDEV